MSSKWTPADERRWAADAAATSFAGQQVSTKNLIRRARKLRKFVK